MGWFTGHLRYGKVNRDTGGGGCAFFGGLWNGGEGRDTVIAY
jgi:hypothetical protein